MGRCRCASRDWTWRAIGTLASLTVVAMQVGARVIALSAAARMRSGSGCRDDAMSSCRVTSNIVGKEVGAFLVMYIYIYIWTLDLRIRNAPWQEKALVLFRHGC